MSSADSTMTENAQNKSQVPLFKKPFNVRYKENPRHSLFDSDMKDSEPDTPDHNVHRPFQRKTRGYTKTNVSFDKILNFSNENIDLSNSSFNLSNVRKNKTLENSLCGKDDTYESGNSFSADPVFQRQKASHAIRVPEVFDDIFEQSSDSSLSNTIRGTYKTNENVPQGKLGNTPDNSLSKRRNTIEQPHDILTQNTNFITRRRLKRKKIIKSNSFDEDLITSESDESFSLKPAFKRHTVVQGVKKSSIFDNDLENTISPNVSITKSPKPKRLPFLTYKKIHAENLSGFDSPLNESLNKSEMMSISHDVFPKKFVKVRADDSINFDDAVNNTCDGSSLSNSLMLKDKSLEKEEKNLHVDKSNASIDSSQLTMTNQTELDISNKTEELNISYSMKLSKLSEINNRSQIVVPRVSITHKVYNESVVQASYANIEEYSVKSPLEFTKESSVNETTMEDQNETLTAFEDQDECVQLRTSIKDRSSESKDTPTKINVMEEDNSGLKNYAETNPSQIHSTENSDTNLTSTGQYYQTVTLTESEIKHTLQSNNLVKDKHEADSSRAIDHSSENVSIPESFETSKNKSIIKQNKMTFNLCITDKHSDKIDYFKEANLTKDHCNSISKIHNLSGNPDNSESRYCKYNKDSDQLSNTDKENNKLLTSVGKIKKQNVKRVSFKLRNEGKESKTGRNSTLNNTYLEDKSYSRYNQSHILNTSCSLENLVFDGSSSEITSDSVYIDLCASRKSSSVNNNNLEGNGYQEDTADKQFVEVKLQCEVSRESEKGEIEMDEDSLEDSDDDKETDKISIEDSDDRLEAGLEENERENVEINGEREKLIECCEENGDNELQQAKPREQVKESTKDSLVYFDESCTINEISLYERVGGEIIHPLQNIHFAMDEILEDNDSSLLSSTKDKSDKPNNVPVNINYQFKKPGPCTVLNEKLSTPPTKRKVQELLARIPLSEFKNKKAKPVSVLLTKEQIEQNKIEEMLRKRQKQSTVRTTKTPKLTKPKYMCPKVYDFIIEKLTPSYGLKSRVQAESVVILLNEQADEIMKNQNKLVQTVQEMKIKLANLKIIHTHWDFYKFIMKYFNVPFIRQVYPSGVVSRFEPDNPHQNVCN